MPRASRPYMPGYGIQGLAEAYQVGEQRHVSDQDWPKARG
jgi:hypothetical protein